MKNNLKIFLLALFLYSCLETKKEEKIKLSLMESYSSNSFQLNEMTAAENLSNFIDVFAEKYFSSFNTLGKNNSPQTLFVKEIPMSNFYQTLNNYLKLFGILFSLADKPSNKEKWNALEELMNQNLQQGAFPKEFIENFLKRNLIIGSIGQINPEVDPEVKIDKKKFRDEIFSLVEVLLRKVNFNSLMVYHINRLDKFINEIKNKFPNQFDFLNKNLSNIEIEGEDVLEDIYQVLKFIYTKLNQSEMFMNQEEKNQFESLIHSFEDNSEGSLRSIYEKFNLAQSQLFQLIHVGQ